MRINPSKKIKGSITIPPDKSISHRSLILTGMARNESTISNILESDDIKSSLNAMQKLGATFSGNFKEMTITPFKKPVSSQLNCENSGTTTRLLSGVVSSYEGIFDFIGDDSLSTRPMKRISEPLTKMGSQFVWQSKEGFLPFTIKGGKLRGIAYDNIKRSAQVKSAILLAGLRADGTTIVYEQTKTRDHTERLLTQMGADIRTGEGKVEIRASEIEGLKMTIPGDFSSAAFFLALAACHEHAILEIKNCSTNPSRTGLFEILSKMGADVSLSNEHQDLEPYGDITIKSSQLTGIQIPDHLIPNMIDELPLIALLGCHANGKTTVRNASELRVKESDRIAILCEMFKNIGVSITELEDGFEIEGPQTIKGGVAESHHDHRMAMLAAVCGVLSQEGVQIKNHECVSVSFPSFFETLQTITG